MQHMSKTLSPPSKPSRVSVPVSAEVLEAFQRLAKAGNMSTGKAMAEWLGDTLDAAKFMAEKMEQARAAPRLVAQELHAYAMGMVDETGSVLAKMREEGRKSRGPASVAGGSVAGRESSPPSCNTGGKVSGERKGKPQGGVL
jgi:hypothetical protein